MHYNYRWVLVFSWYLCLLIACICKQPSLSMENRGVCSQVSHDTAGKGYALWTSPKAFWSLWSGPLGDLRQLHQLVVKYRMNSVDPIWTEKCFSFQVFINWKSALALSKTCIPVISEFKWVICVSQDTPSFFLFSPPKAVPYSRDYKRKYEFFRKKLKKQVSNH